MRAETSVLALKAPAAEPDLNTAEVAIVTGWYAGADLAAIGQGFGASRYQVAQMIRHMRRRGIALTPRPNSWVDEHPGRAHG